MDVKNAVIGCSRPGRDTKPPYATRALAQQTLEAETNRFKFGESTIALVVQAQRDLATSQDAEVQAMANYTHAKIAFDEAVGQTLDVNGISMDEAAAGHVARESSIPADLPGVKAGMSAFRNESTPDIRAFDRLMELPALPGGRTGPAQQVETSPAGRSDTVRTCPAPCRREVRLRTRTGCTV